MAIVDTVARLFAVLLLAVAVFFAIRWIRPKMREQRHRRWEEAGLLPHQVDPYAPREEPGDKDA